MMKTSFKLNPKQKQAMALIGSEAQQILLYGGSRSSKTFLLIRTVVVRALASPFSRHAVLRFRFNHVKASVVYDTFPKVMSLCFPEVEYKLDKTDWYVSFPNGAEIWFGGLDDKERTEKILGQEHATIFLNEASQIPYSSYLMAMTRLAQKVESAVGDKKKPLRLKMLVDCNPPSKGHWIYKLFIKRVDPDSSKPVSNQNDYASMQINPKDNADNLPPEYLKSLENMPARMRKRFWEGEFTDNTDGALFTDETIDKWRVDEHPDLQRVIVGVDPSGADGENPNADDIGIVVGGLGVDGNAYVLEDLTVNAGPSVWGNIAVQAYRRHEGDKVVGEVNYGGEMVKYVIKSIDREVPFKKVNATRGKVIRSEPISSLCDDGKIRFVGRFLELESELTAMTTSGYIGEGSPNRADAFVWVMTELFPKLTKKEEKPKHKPTPRLNYNGPGAWMG